MIVTSNGTEDNYLQDCISPVGLKNGKVILLIPLGHISLHTDLSHEKSNHSSEVKLRQFTFLCKLYL